MNEKQKEFKKQSPDKDLQKWDDRQPKVDQIVRVHYGDKTRSNCFLPGDDMPLQDLIGIVKAVAVGRGPKNVLVKTFYKPEIVPKGNINNIYI